MISENELYDEDLYLQIYHYINSGANLYKKKKKYFKTARKKLNDKFIILNEIWHVFLLIGGIVCITLHLILLVSKLF